MEQLVERMARALVDHPDKVEVTEVMSESDDSITYQLRVDPDDLGKVIGRRGRTASAMRTIISASATKQSKKAGLEIME